MLYHEKNEGEYFHFNKMDYAAQKELIHKNVSIRLICSMYGYLKPKVVIEQLECAIPNLIICRQDVIDFVNQYCEETQN